MKSSLETFYTARMLEFRSGGKLLIEKAPQYDFIAKHGHEFTELVFVASGSALHRHEDIHGISRITQLIPGDFFVINVGEHHSYSDCKDFVLYNMFWISAESEFLKTFRELPNWNFLFGEHHLEKGTAIIHLSTTERIQAERALNNAVTECMTRKPGWVPLVQSIFCEFLIVVLRSTNIRPVTAENCEGIFASIARMEQNLSGNFTINELAASAYMGFSSFTQKFRQVMGCSAMEYLQQLRLKEACHLLLSTDLPMWEIARKCGYNSANYLIRIFKREYHITPLQYKKDFQSRKTEMLKKANE